MKPNPKKKILVVDDEITVCKSIRNAVLSEEYEVDMALSGEEALKKQAAAGYDLVVTDLMMPGISGLDLLSNLKKNQPDVNVIMITGYPTIKTAVEAVKLGAFDYLPKPFTPADLRSLVERVFRKTEKESAGGKKPDPPKLPSGLYCMRGHSWIRREGEDQATIGVLYDFVDPLEEIMAVELPQAGLTLTQGELCARITDKDNRIHRIWAPATGRILQSNPLLLKDPNLVKNDPYKTGWLVRIESSNLDDDLIGLHISV